MVEGAYVQYANTFVTVGGVDLDGGDEAYGDTIYLYDADNQVQTMIFFFFVEMLQNLQ